MNSNTVSWRTVTRLAGWLLLWLLSLGTASAQTGAEACTNRLAVAIYDGRGNGGKGVPLLLEQLGANTNLLVSKLTPEQIRQGELKHYRVIIFSGGSGHGQANALGEAGRAQVRRFVEEGGGYIGICAGSYLACGGFSWGLGLVNARTKSPLWQRGNGLVQVELTEHGLSVLGGPGGAFDLKYAQGPIIEPAGLKDLPAFEVLGWFRTEVAKNNTPQGIMVNSPAVFGAQFKKGRVLCFSPHPEQTPGRQAMVQRAVEWVGR